MHNCVCSPLRANPKACLGTQHHEQVISTDAEMPGDVMFVVGCFAEERMVPVGASFAHHGMRSNQHDAVGAQLLIPVGRPGPGASRPAAGGASQPVAEAQDEAVPELQSECGSKETSENEEAEKLHERLREVEEADDVSEDIQRELGKLLFRMRTVTTGGFRRQYVVGRTETISMIKKLLKRRRDYMQANDLLDDPSPHYGRYIFDASCATPSVGHYIFDDDEREDIMQRWKDSALNEWGCHGCWYSDGELEETRSQNSACETWPPRLGQHLATNAALPSSPLLHPRT